MKIACNCHLMFAYPISRPYRHIIVSDNMRTLAVYCRKRRNSLLRDVVVPVILDDEQYENDLLQVGDGLYVFEEYENRTIEQ